jgi:hypothetical protein
METKNAQLYHGCLSLQAEREHICRQRYTCYARIAASFVPYLIIAKIVDNCLRETESGSIIWFRLF